MSRIHPRLPDNNKVSRKANPREIGEGQCDRDRRPSKFTVWKKSSMSFHGTDGFTVFNEYGELAFRVDNYSRKINSCYTIGRGERGGGLVLMDGAGTALLTLRSKLLSTRQEWNAFQGDSSGNGHRSRVFSMRKPLRLPFFSRISHCKNEDESRRVEAEVFIGGSREYTIEGSFGRRNCCIRRTSTGESIAKISRKRVSSKVVLGSEVFSLVVQHGIDIGLVMGFIVVLDRICRGPPVGPFFQPS